MTVQLHEVRLDEQGIMPGLVHHQAQTADAPQASTKPRSKSTSADGNLINCNYDVSAIINQDLQDLSDHLPLFNTSSSYRHSGYTDTEQSDHKNMADTDSEPETKTGSEIGIDPDTGQHDDTTNGNVNDTKFSSHQNVDTSPSNSEIKKTNDHDSILSNHDSSDSNKTLSSSSLTKDEVDVDENDDVVESNVIKSCDSCISSTGVSSKKEDGNETLNCEIENDQTKTDENLQSASVLGFQSPNEINVEVQEKIAIQCNYSKNENLFNDHNQDCDESFNLMLPSSASALNCQTKDKNASCLVSRAGITPKRKNPHLEGQRQRSLGPESISGTDSSTKSVASHKQLQRSSSYPQVKPKVLFVPIRPSPEQSGLFHGDLHQTLNQSPTVKEVIKEKRDTTSILSEDKSSSSLPSSSDNNNSNKASIEKMTDKLESCKLHNLHNYHHQPNLPVARVNPQTNSNLHPPLQQLHDSSKTDNFTKQQQSSEEFSSPPVSHPVYSEQAMKQCPPFYGQQPMYANAPTSVVVGDGPMMFQPGGYPLMLMPGPGGSYYMPPEQIAALQALSMNVMQPSQFPPQTLSQPHLQQHPYTLLQTNSQLKNKFTTTVPSPAVPPSYEKSSSTAANTADTTSNKNNLAAAPIKEVPEDKGNSNSRISTKTPPIAATQPEDASDSICKLSSDMSSFADTSTVPCSDNQKSKSESIEVRSVSTPILPATVQSKVYYNKSNDNDGGHSGAYQSLHNNINTSNHSGPPTTKDTNNYGRRFPTVGPTNGKRRKPRVTLLPNPNVPKFSEMANIPPYPPQGHPLPHHGHPHTQGMMPPLPSPPSNMMGMPPYQPQYQLHPQQNSQHLHHPPHQSIPSHPLHPHQPDHLNHFQHPPHQYPQQYAHPQMYTHPASPPVFHSNPNASVFLQQVPTTGAVSLSTSPQSSTPSPGSLSKSLDRSVSKTSDLVGSSCSSSPSSNSGNSHKSSSVSSTSSQTPKTSSASSTSKSSTYACNNESALSPASSTSSKSSSYAATANTNVNTNGARATSTPSGTPGTVVECVSDPSGLVIFGPQPPFIDREQQIHAKQQAATMATLPIMCATASTPDTNPGGHDNMSDEVAKTFTADQTQPTNNLPNMGNLPPSVLCVQDASGSYVAVNIALLQEQMDMASQVPGSYMLPGAIAHGVDGASAITDPATAASSPPADGTSKCLAPFFFSF